VGARNRSAAADPPTARADSGPGDLPDAVALGAARPHLGAPAREPAHAMGALESARARRLRPPADRRRASPAALAHVRASAWSASRWRCSGSRRSVPSSVAARTLRKRTGSTTRRVLGTVRVRAIRRAAPADPRA
jgi:hypothetical protein